MKKNQSLTIVFIKIFLVFTGLLVLLFAASHPSKAASGIYEKINFQGKLVNSNGTNVSDGNYSIVFTLYDASSGGSNLWDETQTVAVADGVFQVELGTVDATISSVDFNTDTLYLGVKVGADAEMTPRIRFTAVPYAFMAEKVNGLTVTNTTGTFTLTNGKTLSVANTLSFQGTDSTVFTFPSATGTVVTLDSTGDLTNKTLTAPKFADGGYLADASGNELLILDSNASAVNELTISNGATGVGPTIIASGETNVPLTINSKAAGALTLDSGTTGTVNLGTGNNAKTLNLGTGNAGNTINIGTNNTVADTINLGSVLDNIAITSDSWSITDAGALTVASCSGCGAGGTTWNTIGTPTGSLSLSFDAGEITTLTSSSTTQSFFNLTGTSFTTGELLDLAGTWAASDASDNEAVDINLTYTPTSLAGTFRGVDLNVTEGANALANALYGLKLTTDNSANTSTGTHSIYGGHFTATGKTAGTTTAVGLYATATGADNNYAAIFENGGVGIGTTTVPHAGVGWAKLALEGAKGSAAGPHIQVTIPDDDYPIFQMLNYDHDNINLAFDAYFDGSVWKSSVADTGSNFYIYKYGNRFAIDRATGFTQGGTITWSPGFQMLPNGVMGINTSGSGSALEINSGIGVNLRLTYNDENGSAANYTDFTLSSSGALTITGSNATLADSATAEKTFLTLTPGTINLTGTTTVTSVMDTSIITGATITASGATTVNDAAALSLTSPIDSTNTTISRSQALRIKDTSSGAGTLTSLIGLYIEPQTGGATTNYGICFDCDGTWTSSTVASGIQFGSDANAVNLYRNGSDTLRTDDLFSAAALTLGTNPADAGTLRIPNDTYITTRNAANSANINLIKIDSSNLVAFGANTAAFTLGGAITGNSQNITALAGLTINGGGTITSATSGTLGVGTTSNTTGITLGNSTGTSSIAFDVTTSGNFILRKNGSAFDCSGQTNGGALSTDSSGNITCTADDGGGGGTTLQQAYDAGATILTDATGDVIIQTIGGTTDTQFEINAASAPEIDMMLLTNSGQGTTTDGVDGLSIDFVQGTDTNGTDSNSGLRITITPGSETNNTIDAINIANVTPGSAVERGIVIGTGYDRDIEFSDTTPTIRLADATTLTYDDGGTSTTGADAPLGRLKEYFSGANYGVWEGGGFINIDGSFRMDQFVRSTLNITADAIGSAQRLGDYQDWQVDEAGTGAGGTNTQQVGCVVRTGGDTNFASVNRVNGAMQIVLDTTTVTGAMNNWCIVQHGAGNGSTATNNGILQVANKFIVYYKVRLGTNVTNSASNRYVYLGVNNMTGGTTGRPANNSGIWFSNVAGNQTQTGTNYTAGTSWVGNVNNGTNATNYSTVGCSGANLSVNTATNAWALMRIEARATNDVRFFIDSNVSDGVSLSECGSVTNNIPTNPMKPSIMVANALTNNQTWDLIVDLFAYVQDDPRDGSGGGLESSEESTIPPPPPDPIIGADLAENYVMDGDFETGDIVAIGARAGVAERASRPNDRRLLGVVSESPALMMGEAASGFTTAPIGLTGRVPVKVTAKNGEIKIGDPITSSDIPGVGMRAKEAGKIIGTAMENYNSLEVGKIMVNVNVGYYIGDETDTAILEQPREAVISTTSGGFNLGKGVVVNSTGSAVLVGNDPLASSSASVKQLTQSVLSGEIFEIITAAIFKAPVEYLDRVVFKGITEFIGQVVFRNEVEFENKVAFNNDSAGYAEVKKGQRFVDIIFGKEYTYQPVINISPTILKLNDETFKKYIQEGLCQEIEGIEVCQDKIADLILSSEIKFAVQNQTTQGFLILLNKDAPIDFVFSWQALAVKNVKTSSNNGPAGLVLPFEGNYKPSNKFGEHSTDPVIKEKDMKNGLKGHDGIDIGMPVGTPVLSVDEGEVELENSDYGKTLVIRHIWGKTVYGHLSEVLAKKGDKIKKGEKIALSGNTGLSTGPHLHFGMKINNRKNSEYADFVNPMNFLTFVKEPTYNNSEAKTEVAGVADEILSEENAIKDEVSSASAIQIESLNE